MTEAAARTLDDADPLAGYRERFALDPATVYLKGNSLGAMPLGAPDAVGAVLDQWRTRQVRAWNEGWYDLSRRLGAKVAEFLGVDADEVIIAESTTIGLHKLCWAALEAQPGRSEVVTDDLNFPSDLYALQGLARQREARLKVIVSDGIALPPEGIAAGLTDETGLLSLSHTAYRSSFVHDMHAVQALARRRGVLAVWDVSHSFGVVPIPLRASGAEMAVGCLYKYASGGPGAPAFLYVRRDLQNRLGTPLQGWFGHAAPFEFEDAYRPPDGVARFLTGTPTILSLAAIEPGLQLLGEVGIAALRSKSESLTAFALELFDALPGDHGVALATPREPDRRGGHIAFRHAEAFLLSRALIAEDIIVDYRAPDLLRMGFAPLTTRFVDVWRAIDRLGALLASGAHRAVVDDRPVVT